jgi:hypothetical protein
MRDECILNRVYHLNSANERTIIAKPLSIRPFPTPANTHSHRIKGMTPKSMFLAGSPPPAGPSVFRKAPSPGFGQL